MNPPKIRTQAPTRPVELPRAAFLLYGQPKTGKTATAAQFPRPLILNVLAENGTTQVAGDVTDIAKPGDLKEIVDWLKANPAHHGYQSVVLDGISTLCTEAVVEADSRDTRKAVKDATAVLRPVLHAFLGLPMIRVITGHARQEEEEVIVDGHKVAKLSTCPDLPPRLRLFVEGRVDAIGYCYAGNGKSLVWWLPLDTDTPRPRAIAAGNRLGLPKTTELSFPAIQAAILTPAK